MVVIDLRAYKYRPDLAGVKSGILEYAHYGGNVVSFPGEGGKRKAAEPAPAASSSIGPGDSAPRQSAAANAAQAYDHASTGQESRLPAPTFLSLANMLGVEAAMHLGLIEAAPGAGRSVDLDAARHVVDLLGLLQEKTRGNLTAEEDTLLDNMLADLRMQFVAASRRR